MAFVCGDRVLYGIHGVCHISDIETRSVSGNQTAYYVLVPVALPESRYYVPVQNQAAVAKLHKLLTAEELDTILHSPTVHANAWIADEGRRKLRYRELLNGSDRGAMISMVRTLRNHRTEQLAAGRKFHQCDENFLRDAEKLLNSEISIVLNIPQSDVGEYVRQTIG